MKFCVRSIILYVLAYRAGRCKEMDYQDYGGYLSVERKMSENTKNAYMRDLRSFETFVKERGLAGPQEAANTEILAYLMELRAENKSKATLNRKLASLRVYYSYLQRKGLIGENPADGIKSPKADKKEIEYISIEEVDKLMQLPDASLKGMRDRAILELLYATGIRASELIEMKTEDVNLRMGFVKCAPLHGKARIIPMGRICRKAMEDYILDARDKILKGKEEAVLFTNYAGKPITRQGLWKILKEYGQAAELSVGLTPQVLRNSFAVHMLRNGADVKSLQELMGHEDISATQAYLAVVKNRIKDVYDRTHPRA